MRLVAVVLLVALAAGAAWASWSAPAAVSTDIFASVHPAANAIGTQGLWAAWLEKHDSMASVIRGSYWDGLAWLQVQDLTPRTDITVGPALVANPAHDSVMLSYYLGEVPTLDDTWALYSVMADSVGAQVPQRICYAPSLGVADLRMGTNGTGEPGIIYETGSMVSAPDYVDFIGCAGGTWADTLRVASGMEYPPYLEVIVSEPRIAGGPGDTVLLANSNYTNNQGSVSNTVSICRHPGDSIIGGFRGKNPELAYNPFDGRLHLAYCAGGGGDSVFGARSYTPSTGWSALQVLDSSWSPYYSSASLAVDPEGYVWVAYANGSGAHRVIQARYCRAGTWSAPETVAADTGAENPVIASDNSGRIWVLWDRALALNRSQVFAVYRQVRPGVGAESQSGTRAPLLDAWPNPCRGEVSLQLASPASGSAVLVFDRSGKLVRTLALPHAPFVASARLTWDCRDASGARVPDGCYFVTARDGIRVLRNKVIVSR